jgi:hydroxymethylpyrimidine/phosphomethylpyrimidine kinase
MKNCVLTIAGSDSSGGAGIQADIKAISATGSYAASVITALTAQNTLGVQSIHTIPADFVQAQLDSVFSDMHFDAIKIGMLVNREIIDVVANTLEKIKPKHVILDPVMVAKKGCQLLDPEIVDYLQTKLFPLATLVTPNLPEAENFLNAIISSPETMQSSAEKLGRKFKSNVLIKGGHLPIEKSSDVLFSIDADKCEWFHAERIATTNAHGTGCTLSSAIASFLAQSYSLSNAIHAAKNYLTQAIIAGSKFQIGNGCGPVAHFYFLESLRKNVFTHV